MQSGSEAWVGSHSRMPARVRSLALSLDANGCGFAYRRDGSVALRQVEKARFSVLALL